MQTLLLLNGISSFEINYKGNSAGCAILASVVSFPSAVVCRTQTNKGILLIPFTRLTLPRRFVRHTGRRCGMYIAPFSRLQRACCRNEVVACIVRPTHFEGFAHRSYITAHESANGATLAHTTQRQIPDSRDVQMPTSASRNEKPDQNWTARTLQAKLFPCYLVSRDNLRWDVISL